MSPSPLKAAGTSGALTIGSQVMRSDKVVQAEVNGEIVALHVERGACYGLNPIASRVWSLAEAPVNVSDICVLLQEEFSVSPQECEADVLELLEGLRAEGLIDLLGEPDARAI